MKLFNDDCVNLYPYFRVSISDIGGHISLKHGCKLYNVIIDNVMNKVISSIEHEYDLSRYADFLAVPLSKAILGLPVKKWDNVNIRLRNELSGSQFDGVLNLVFESEDNYYTCG